MIDIKKLTEKDKGKTVYYRSFDGFEAGILKSWNDVNIFVVYYGNNFAKMEHYDRYTAAATKPEDLFWSKNEEPVALKTNERKKGGKDALV